MAEDGISIPKLPKPIQPISEGELPEAPRPGSKVAREPLPGKPSAPPAPESRAARHEHHYPPKAPPLFIKVDKYREVVDNIQRMKSLALSMRDALDALADIEKELTTGISIAHKALDDFNTIISTMDSKLTRVGEISGGTNPSSTSGQINSYVRDIYSQMDRIKGELDSVAEEV